MFTRKECLKRYGSDYIIRQHVAAGDLFRLDKHIYSEEKNVPELAVIAFKYPHAAVTMHTAFYLHGMTDTIPDEYDLATDRNATKIQDPKVKQYFLPADLFPLGMEKMNYKGYDILVYGKERMLIELLRYKSKVPYDYYKELILNYRRLMPRLNIQKIRTYAQAAPRSDRILETLQTEVL